MSKSTLSPQARAVLERWGPMAHDSMAVLGDGRERIGGKPWDYADYIRVFRMEGDRVFLEVDAGEQRTSGYLEGLSGASAAQHPWGSTLTLDGPLRWVGTRTQGPTGLVKMAAELLPSLGQQQRDPYAAWWPQIVLVLPFTWTP
ncbi:MAG: hypothetical protein ACI9VR_002226 [Cognaticolwellia sp.]